MSGIPFAGTRKPLEMARRKPWIYANPECQGKSTEFKDLSASILDEATECLDEYTGRLDSTAVLMDGGTDLEGSTPELTKPRKFWIWGRPKRLA